MGKRSSASPAGKPGAKSKRVNLPLPPDAPPGSMVGRGVNPRNYQKHEVAIAHASVLVPRESVRPNPWNYNVQKGDTFAKTVASLRTFGFVQPIVVRTLPDGVKEIINGEHRWRAAGQLGMAEVPIVDLGVIDDAKAKQLSVVLNELGGEPDLVRLADVLRDVNAAVGFEALAATLPFPERELTLMLSEVTFSFAALSTSDTRAPEPAESSDEAQANAAIEGDVNGEAPAAPPAPEAAPPPGVATKALTIRLPTDRMGVLMGNLGRIAQDPSEAVERAVSAFFENK